MYAGLVGLVDIPDGKVRILRNGYVYWITESHWDNERKMTVDNRVGIGKIADGEKGKMYPNRKYEEIFGPIDQELAELKKKYEPIATRQLGKTDSVMSYAPYAVLIEACNKCGCLGALKKAFPNKWHKIFAVAMHAIVAENSTAQSFPGWAFDNYCGLKSSISDSDISKLYSFIGGNAASVSVFFELYRDGYHKAFPKSGERVEAFDSTNQRTDSGSNSRAKRGKSKEGGLLPIANTAMYVDESTGIAQYYEHFDGNILDKTETPYTVEKAAGLGFNKLFLMQDRGYFSQGNLESLDGLGVGYGMMMPETADFVGDLINANLGTIKLKEEFYIGFEDIYGLDSTVEINGREYPVFVYYDDNTARTERDTIHGNVNYWLGEANKRKKYTDKMESHFAKRAIKIEKTDRDKETGRNFIATVDYEAVEESIRTAGAFVILSNRSMKASEMIGIARKRDCVEKSFRTLKNHFNLKRTYTHGDKTYDGKMFVAFIALVTLQTYSWLIKDILHAKTSETVATTISELHKYKMERKKDGSWMPVYACNKQQKEILSCFGLNQEKMEKAVRAIKNRV